MKAIKTCNAIKVGGERHEAGKTLLVGKGKDISLKDAQAVVDAEAAQEVVEPSDEKGDVGVEEMAQVEDLNSLNVTQLKLVCEHLGGTQIPGKKADLINLIESIRSPKDILDLDAMDESQLRALAADEAVDLSGITDVEAIRNVLENELGE